MSDTFLSSSNFYGRLWSETYAGTGEYEGTTFVPTVYSFSINPDTLEPTNVSIVTKGTPLPIGSVSDSVRKNYICESVTSPRIFWYSNRGHLYPRYHDNSISAIDPWLSGYDDWETGEYSSAGMLVGAYYHPTTKRTYIFVSARNYVDDNWDTFSYLNKEGGTYSYWSTDYVESMNEYVKTMFYADTADNRKIVRESPLIDVFKRGESQVLQYKLVDVFGNSLSSSPTELLVYPGTGWGYTEESNTLRYISGAWSTKVTVKFIYEETEYQLNDTFYPEGANIYNTGGIATSGGGKGYYSSGSFGSPESSDNVSSDLPLGSVEGDASATGFYTRYLCNGTTLGIFGDWLWATDLGLQIAKTAISLLYGDPSEAVISLMSYPFNISSLSGVTTRVQDIFWGNFDSNVPSIALTSQAAYIDWGTITLDEYWGNFLDYSPHTKIDLFLPWSTGSVEIDPGECLPGTLRVVTNIDLNKGSCIHNVIGNNGSVIGQYAGQCGKQIPILSSDIASKSAGLVTAAVAIGSSAVVSAGIGASAGIKAGADAISPTYSFASKEFGDTGKYFVERTRNTLDFSKEKSSISQAMRTGGKVVSTALAAFKTPTHISRNGGFTDGSASLSIQYPYIILSRSYQSIPESYGHHYGYPSNIYAQLSSLVGYTEVGEIHLDGIPATDAELTELDRLLKGGVIL